MADVLKCSLWPATHLATVERTERVFCDAASRETGEGRVAGQLGGGTQERGGRPGLLVTAGNGNMHELFPMTAWESHSESCS